MRRIMNDHEEHEVHTWCMSRHEEEHEKEDHEVHEELLAMHEVHAEPLKTKSAIYPQFTFSRK